MDLSAEICAELNEVITKNYEKGDYTGAIVDSILYACSVIRDKSGLEADGVALIGSAFGGDRPPIRVSRLQTESEKNLQKGIEHILRGVIQGIRNPRSHEKHEDTKGDADSIIVFIDFLLRIINRATIPFSITEYTNRVFDEDFVEDENYAKLLVDEVPKPKLADVLYTIYRSKECGKPHKLRFFLMEIFGRLTDQDQKTFLRTVSDELKTTSDETSIRILVTAFGGDHWSTLDEVGRIRIENKLIKSISEGRFDASKGRCVSGALGTWASSIASNMTLLDRFRYILSKKLGSSSREEQDYVFQYFGRYVVTPNQPPNNTLVRTIKQGLQSGDRRFYDLVNVEMSFPSGDWIEQIRKDFENFKEKEEITLFDDDIPF